MLWGVGVVVGGGRGVRGGGAAACGVQVEAEASICICLKSRSDFISSYLSESMPLALERCSVLRETTCSRRKEI